MKLSASQQALIVDIIGLAAQTHTTADLDQLLDGPLKTLFGYEVALCGIGVAMEKGCYGHKFHNHGFPLDYFFEFEQSDGTVDTPLMKHWRQVRKPVYFQSGRDDDAWPADWIRIFNRFDLRNILSNAILDRHDVVSNWFIFARMEDPPGPEHAHALELITPALCQGLVRALETVECADIFAGAVHAVFSYRQRQILQWIYHGKTNWEISRILDINEETVKYHVEQAMKKLDVATRAQAVGRALEIGIIAAAKQP